MPSSGKCVNAWQFLMQLHQVCHFVSREGRKQGGGLRASSSEVKRWVQQGALEINGEKVAWDEPMDFPMFSVVLFPKGKRVTLL